ncbi:MarR family transcriptional regulator [Photobacterium sp. 1_MG-2023]|uniref:MarR family transcriptional regulator n=1 Tax=Photobacterium sp. 1_MG-2023 TaxID=3062646 RepID=UPI0026E1CC61|nr:MarR family transcriptional regulator [Photobacterium sp. 1_MG-2023]MDO6707375.1 MarR family transcriptional regulator [Photobacterium sp. 1_MG-2023]
MRISHKRKVQLKLQKRIQAATTVAQKPVTKAAVKKAAPAKAAVAKPQVEEKQTAPAAPVATSVSLTPKQQQVLDIVAKNAEGINPKSIGLEAGQEDSKAASWATGALKKLVEESLVERIQLAGNKVVYKAL